MPAVAVFSNALSNEADAAGLKELARGLPECMVSVNTAAWKKSSLCNIYWGFIVLQNYLNNEVPL